MSQYKLKIIYTSEKKNDRTDALNRRNDYIRSKKVFDQNVLKINNDGSLSFNKREFNVTMRILCDNQEQYSVIKEKLQISDDKIDDCIKKYHNESLQEHSKVTKTIQFLRRECQFFHMQQKVEIYIKKCFKCQQNKHAIHAEYNEIQYTESSIEI